MIDVEDQQQFYEVLTLLKLCRPATGIRVKPREIHGDYQKEAKLWHRVLDDLSWLADKRTGGRSVTSIAGIQFGNKQILLVAGNRPPSNSTMKHVRNVLNKLRNCSGLNDKMRAATIEQIFLESIEHSKSKVKNYKTQLLKYIEEIAGFDRTTEGG